MSRLLTNPESFRNAEYSIRFVLAKLVAEIRNVP